MPGVQDPADQVKFLVSCIGHTTNGRVRLPPFSLLPKIPTKTPPSLISLPLPKNLAFQKRYERMLKANGVTANKTRGNDSALPTPEVTPVKRKTAAPRTPVSAKRARGTNVKKEESDDDESKKDVKKQEDTDSELSDPPLSE
ncbi:bifunctional chorismate synthase/riboflavin reductase [Epichloe bromicola]